MPIPNAVLRLLKDFKGYIMNIDSVNIDREDVRKLLLCGSGDSVLLYLYLRCGNDPAAAQEALHMSEAKLSCAGAILRQLGLWQEQRHCAIMPGERPNYSERDVLEALDRDNSFQMLQGEIQRLLGRSLNTEDLKILLGFTHYLGLSADVISVLVCYCKDRARQRGNLRNPSLRTIEKEAYAWAEQGIDTMEEAAAFIQAQNIRQSRMAKLMRILQIRGRNLTAGEERYASNWLDMGFDEEAITMAYERTCLNTGGLSWAYMNKILTRWHNAGLHTGAQVRAGDQKPDSKSEQRQLDPEEKAAIARMMQEG